MDSETEGKLVSAVERIAVANEELIRLATEERDTGDSARVPPFCPHCGVFDPEIRNQGGAGKMGEFVLVAGCTNCGKTFFATTENWLIVKTIEELKGRE
jgi:hypothetical protein